MALFANQQESNLRACEQMVEAVLEGRGVHPKGSRIANAAGPAWGLSQGSARIFIFLTAGGGGDNFIQVLSPVMRPSPEAMSGTGFMRRLLELNANELTGAAFGLRDD